MPAEKTLHTSSDESIIKVHDNGEIAGVGYGTATLTLKSADGFCKYSWKCTVTDKETTCWYTMGYEISSKIHF